MSTANSSDSKNGIGTFSSDETLIGSQEVALLQLLLTNALKKSHPIDPTTNLYTGVSAGERVRWNITCKGKTEQLPNGGIFGLAADYDVIGAGTVPDAAIETRVRALRYAFKGTKFTEPVTELDVTSAVFRPTEYDIGAINQLVVPANATAAAHKS